MLRFDRRLLDNFDWVMLGTVLAIGGMGLLNLYSASFAAPAHGQPVYMKQLYFFAGGFLLIFFIVSIDYRVLITWNYPLYGCSLILLAVALFFGKNIAGTQRWIDLGFFNLQPAEPAKVMLVITLASYYYRQDTGKGFTLKELVVPVLIALVPFLLVLKQPDLGTALMFAFVFVSMTLFVKLKWTTLWVLLTTCISAVPIGWLFFLKPYQRQRIETFLNPESDPYNTGYHIIQSKIAVGSGLILGKGYLKGTQGHLDFLPERHTDFAFSVWAEEWGFVGSLFFIGCYFFLILWGMNVVTSSRDKFGAILAFGIVSLIFWQAFINLAMVLGLLPVVGMPLPLFSYGGSSLIVTMAGIGVLMNIRMRRYLSPT